MTGVPAIHHSVGYVQTSAGEIGPTGYINDAADRPTVNAHADVQARMLFERATNLECAANRPLRSGVENQRHAVASGDLNQSLQRIRFSKLLSRANDLRQLI